MSDLSFSHGNTYLTFLYIQVDQSTEKLNQLEAKLKELEEEINVTNNSLDVNKVQKEITEAEQKRDR